MYITAPQGSYSKPQLVESFHYHTTRPQIGDGFGELKKDTQKTSKRKKYSDLDWNKLNCLQKIGYGTTYLFVGLSMTLMTAVMPKKEVGHILAFKRGKNISSDLEAELENYKKGIKTPPKSNQEEKSEAWDTFKRTNMSVLFSYLGSKQLVTATVHLDPKYKTQQKESSSSKLASEEFKAYSSKDMGVIGKAGHKLMSWNFKFSEKYDIADDCDYYIPAPPPKLSSVDNFFLKHYFKTKPSWEYTEEERLKLSKS